MAVQETFLDPELLDRALGAGRTGVEGATNAYGRDFQELASQKTDMLTGMLAPQQDRRRKELEARLLAQGRLGSTSGGVDMEAQEAAFGQQNLQAQLAGLDLARQERSDQFGMGLNLAQLGLGANQQEVGLGMERDSLDLARDQFEFQKRQASRKKKGGLFGSFLSSVAGGLGTALGGPAGGFLGKAVGGLFGD